MTSRADQNDQWASYAAPGGWNGTYVLLTIINSSACFSTGVTTGINWSM
jgi:hypothetical protein